MTSSGLDCASICSRPQFVRARGLCVAWLLIFSDAVLTCASRMTKQNKNISTVLQISCSYEMYHCCDLLLWEIN